MKKILFPSDFSKTANNAFDYACKLANQWNANIDVIHIYNNTLTSKAFSKYYDIDSEVIHEEKIKDFENKVDELIEINKTDRVHNKKLIYGRVVSKEIAKFAKDGAYDMIVMGMKGEHNRIEKIMGSVTTNLMEKAECPVLAIPEKASFREIKKMAYATDLSKGSDMGIDKAFDFSDEIGAELNFLHVDHIVYEKSNVMERAEMSVAPKLEYTKLYNPSIVDGIQDYLNKLPVDMLCLYFAKRKLWEMIFPNQTTRKIAFHTEIPLLVFQN